VLRTVNRRVTYRALGGAAVVALLVALGVARRDALHRSAIGEWSRRSSSAVQIASGSAHAWIAERAAAVRMVGASGSRSPALFNRPANAGSPLADSALTSRLATALKRVNQASAAANAPFSDLWLLNRAGAFMGSATQSTPPAVVVAAMRAAGETDSLIVVGPFPSSDNEVYAVFLQPVLSSADESAGVTGHATTIGAVAMAARLDATSLRRLGVALPEPTSQHRALVARVGDSVYAYTLSKGGRGFRVHAIEASQAGSLILKSLRAPGILQSPDGRVPAVAAHIDGMPWGLVLRANRAALVHAADADFVHEVSTVLIILTFASWLAFARGHRERARHLRGLAASEARYRLLADHSTDIIARFAPDGRVLYVSPAVRTVLGYEPQAVVNTYPFALRHDDDADVTRTGIHRVLSLREAARTEHRFRHADGHFVWLETVGTAVRDSVTGEVTEVITTSRDIVDAKASEEALKTSEEQYRLLFETNPMPMWAFDAETGRFLAVNNAAVEHYGYSRDEFQQMTILDVRPQEFVHEVLTAEERMMGVAGELRGRHHRKKDGTIIDVDLMVHPLPSGDRVTRLVLINDVTQKNEIEAAFRESSQFIRAILGSSPVAIIATDLELRVVQWNRASEQLFGWRADEVIGKQSPIAVPAADGASVAELRQALLDAGQLAGREEELTRKDGTRVKVDVSVAVIHNGAGVPAGFVTLAVDLTERTRLEAQLLQAQKMEAVGQFAGGIAHDFNNLLTVITAYAELLIADVDETAPKRADLQEIKGAASRAAALVRQLLAFSRRQVLVPSLIDLNAVVLEIEQMLRRVLPPTVTVVTSLDPELRAVFADTGQVEQVLMNLVVNARDAMADGGTLTIATANVATDPTDRAMDADTAYTPDVILTVSDTGCGMSREVQARIFEPFFTTKEVGKGTGLGLSTAHGIVSQSGGRLTVASTEGLGTTFTMYLPAAASPADTNATQSAGQTSGRPASGVVLLVDDDAAVRYVAARILETAGYRVLIASDGPEALAIHAQHGASIDVLITDMVMPTMTGTAVTEALRAERPHLPVVLMSGLADDAMASGIAGDPVMILRKPFTPDEFIRKAADAQRASSRTRRAREATAV
jgi:two-component system, cell cycle sensor histidine kinase and response regulator CckA